jgi:SurA N-terminal domain/PPIC-type PPIASE domain
VWQPRGVQIRRLTAVAVAGLALAGLAGCRTSPNVAAYVGEEQVTVTELEAAVESRLENEAIAEFASADPEDYTRRVLGALVETEVHDVAAERYGVTVTDGEVTDRIEALLGGQDPAEVFTQLAAQGVSRQDIEATVRQQLIRLEIAEQEGLAEGLSESDLRAAYEQVAGQQAQYEIGYITVPSQEEADMVVAQLANDPGAYAALAERYAGEFTLAEVQTVGADQLPGPLAEGVTQAEPGTAFAVPVEETGGVVVTFVSDVVRPSFEELRPQLEQQALEGVEAEVAGLIQEVREDIDLTVNPRFGELEEGQIRPAEGDVVDILTDEG